MIAQPLPPPSPPRRLVILLHRQGFEPLYQAASIGLTAAAIGDEVTLVPFFGGLLTLCGRVDYAHDPSAQRAQALGLPDPRHMLGDGRHTSGLRVVACETAVLLAGLELDEVRPYLDEITGLATVWKRAAGAQLLYV